MVISEDGTRNYKIVYWGPGLCGKTTSIQYIYENTPENLRTQLISLATDLDRVLFCSIREENICLHPYTLPGSIYYEESRRNLLKGVDGIVFVVDSQEERINANVESLLNLRECLKFYNRDLAQILFVLSINKRDFPNILSVDEIIQKLKLENVTAFETIASKGIGVIESFEKMRELIIEIEEPSTIIKNLNTLSDEELLNIFQTEKDSIPKKNAIIELAKRGKFLDKSVVKTLINCLNNEKKSVRRESAKVLISSQNGKPLEEIIQKLSDPNEVAHIKGQIIYRISPTDNEIVLNSVINCLYETDNYLKILAVEYLGKVKNKIVIDHFVKLLTDKNQHLEVRRTILRELEKFDDDRVVEAVLQTLDNDKLSWESLCSLGRLKDKRAVDPIISLINSKKFSEFFELRFAISALGDIGDERAIPILQRLAKHKSFDIRKDARESLDKLNANDVGF